MLFGSYFIRCVRLIVRYLSWCREQCLRQTSEQEIQKLVRRQRHKYRRAERNKKGTNKACKRSIYEKRHVHTCALYTGPSTDILSLYLDPVGTINY